MAYHLFTLEERGYRPLPITYCPILLNRAPDSRFTLESSPRRGVGRGGSGMGSLLLGCCRELFDCFGYFLIGWGDSPK